MSRVQPVETVGDFLTLAACYAGSNGRVRPRANVGYLKCLIDRLQTWQSGHTRKVLLSWLTFMLNPKERQNQYQTLTSSNGSLKRFGQQIARPSLNKRLQLLPLDAL